jgi:hypothetical protein
MTARPGDCLVRQSQATEWRNISRTWISILLSAGADSREKECNEYRRNENGNQSEIRKKINEKISVSGIRIRYFFYFYY